MGAYIGFAVYGSDTITFNNLAVVQLHTIMEYTSVDPGEAASMGLSRAISYEQLRVQARYDGLLVRSDAKIAARDDKIDLMDSELRRAGRPKVPQFVAGTVTGAALVIAAAWAVGQVAK